MFNKKEIQELKEELKQGLESLRTEFSLKLEQHTSILTTQLSDIRETNTDSATQITKELVKINEIKSEFELTLNRLNSISRSIETNAATSVREVVEKEIESIKASSKQFRLAEEDLRQISNSINSLQLELSKFISISQNIKLVDFTLKQYQSEMSRSEKERRELINENEDLKSKMARIIRRRST